MTTTPLWVPILVAGLGVLGTLGGTIVGVIISHRRADRRESAAWEREQEREFARWAREDALRTFEHRRDAYTDFYESLREMAFNAYNFGMGLTDFGELEPEWQLPTYRKLQHLQVYATESVWAAANEAYSAAWRWGHEAKHGQDDETFYAHQQQYDANETWLLTVIRRDLSIPDD